MNWVPSITAVIGLLSLAISIAWHCQRDRDRFKKMEGRLDMIERDQGIVLGKLMK